MLLTLAQILLERSKQTATASEPDFETLLAAQHA